MTPRPYDLVLFGASGFTGQLVAEYLLEQYGVDGDLRWALAGRNREKLERVRSELQGKSKQTPLTIIEADSGDAEALAALAAQSRVICSTVGPYAQYGTPLVKACAEAGTDYCDLTGEVPWIARTIADYQSTAESTGARIVHCCGFDSIPSDMGNWFAQTEMLKRHGVAATRVRARVGKTRGAASGGTVVSLIGVLKEASTNPELREQLRNKYWLYPTDEEPGPAVSDQVTPRFDACFDKWTSPFVMALINERIVRRSNALLGFPWGKDFNYDEAQLCANRFQAFAISAGLGAAMLTGSTAPGRLMMEKLLPKPGEGPDREARENGCFELFLHAEHPEDSDKSVQVCVSGQRDPGYGATSRMLGEAAVCLAMGESTVGGGIWTPASALAPALLPRLESGAELNFSLIH